MSFKKALSGIFIAVTIALLLSACSVERQMGRKYIARADSTSFLVLFPAEVFVVNKKNENFDGSFLFSEAQKDTSLFRNSVLLPFLNDEAILKPFKESFVKELSNYGYRVYDTTQMDQFMAVDHHSRVLNVAQIELQEYLTSYEDAVTVDEQVYTKVIYLNGINIGSWFEISPINEVEKAKIPVLFATHDLTDRWNGYFVQRFLTGEIEYRLEIDSLQPNDVFNFAAYLGRLYAAYTFDYMLNRDIKSKTPLQEQTESYYRYDPYQKRLFVTDQDKFIELE